MTPERIQALKSLRDKVQASYIAGRPADCGERINFRAGAHEYRLGGIAGTSTMSTAAAMASWLRTAHRKLTRADTKVSS